MKTLYLKIKSILFEIICSPVCAVCENPLQPENWRISQSPDLAAPKFSPVCKICMGKIHIHNSFFCPICFKRLPNIFSRCRHKKSPKYILAAATDYSDKIIQKMVLSFKYSRSKPMGDPLSKICIKYLKNIQLCKHVKNDSALITFIPLHPKKERQRGFNQSRIIAQKISQGMEIPLKDTLQRIKNTDPNARIKNKNERISNISECFRIIKSSQVQNKNIILVDDIHTTGATMAEASKILKNAGAKKIIALVIAKA